MKGGRARLDRDKTVYSPAHNATAARAGIDEIVRLLFRKTNFMHLVTREDYHLWTA